MAANNSGVSAEPKRPSLLSNLSRSFSSSHQTTSSVPTTEPTSTEDLPTDNQNTRLKSFVKAMVWMGTKVAETVDYVGEGVVSVLGLDDSRFQDVLDNMTDEQREYAEAVHNERQQEYRDAGILVDEVVPNSDDIVAEVATVSSAGNSDKLVDVESGPCSTTSVLKNTAEVEMTTSSNVDPSSTHDIIDTKDIIVDSPADNV